MECSENSRNFESCNRTSHPLEKVDLQENKALVEDITNSVSGGIGFSYKDVALQGHFNAQKFDWRIMEDNEVEEGDITFIHNVDISPCLSFHPLLRHNCTSLGKPI